MTAVEKGLEARQNREGEDGKEDRKWKGLREGKKEGRKKQIEVRVEWKKNGWQEAKGW